MSELDAGPDVDTLAVLGGDIPEPDHDAADAARARLAAPESLGRLAALACWWASVRGDAAAPPARQVLMVGADAAVAARRPGARAVALPAAGEAGGDTGAAVEAALDWGRSTADDAADRGVELVVLAVDDPVATRALAADLLGLDAVEASGWPQDRGLEDETWMAEVAALRDRLNGLRGLRDRPAEALRVLGAPATAGALALLLQAMVRRTPVLLDGAGAAAAALVARRLSYLAGDWVQAAQHTADPTHERALASLGVEPLTRLDVSREDGTAGLVGLAVLDQAALLLGPGA